MGHDEAVVTQNSVKAPSPPKVNTLSNSLLICNHWIYPRLKKEQIKCIEKSRKGFIGTKCRLGLVL